MYLNMSSNAISPEGTYALCKALKNYESLFTLDLSSKEGLHRNRLHETGAKGLTLLLKKSKILSILNLSGTSLGNKGLR